MTEKENELKELVKRALDHEKKLPTFTDKQLMAAVERERLVKDRIQIDYLTVKQIFAKVSCPKCPQWEKTSTSYSSIANAVIQFHYGSEGNICDFMTSCLQFKEYLQGGLMILRTTDNQLLPTITAMPEQKYVVIDVATQEAVAKTFACPECLATTYEKLTFPVMMCTECQNLFELTARGLQAFALNRSLKTRVKKWWRMQQQQKTTPK